MDDKNKKKVTDVLNEAKNKIRVQLENTVKNAADVGKNMKESVNETSINAKDKVTETAKDSKAVLQENAENVATLLSVMLIL